MPDTPRRLTLSFVRRVREPGRYYDQDGLILTVSKGGGKSWIQRLTIQGRRQDIGLGSAYLLTPAHARKLARKNKEIARAGGNPLAPQPDGRRSPRTEPRKITFSRFTLTRHRRLIAAGLGLTSVRKERSRITRLVIPRLGRIPMSKVSAEDIQNVITEISKNNTNIADVVRRQLATIFDEAIDAQIRPDNPVRSGEIVIVKKTRRVTSEGDTRNRRVLSELPAFLDALRNSGRRPGIILLIQFTLLSLRHPKECRLATWSQIDAERRVWRFPNMQKEDGEIVEITLHDGLWEILQKATLIGRGDRTGWMFPSPTEINKSYTENAGYKVPQELGFDIAQLDFRRAYEYWAEKRPDKGSGLEAWYQNLTATDSTSSVAVQQQITSGSGEQGLP